MKRPDAGFSALECAVISLAKRDRLSSLDHPGPITRALDALFGRGCRPRLANPRLEALRRMAVHARYRERRLPLGEIRHFLSAGFRSPHLRALIASVAVEHRHHSIPASIGGIGKCGF